MNNGGIMNMGMSSYPMEIDETRGSYLERNYDVLYGEYPSNEREMVLVVDNRNRVDINALSSLGFDVSEVETMKFGEIVGTEFKLISNNSYYEETEFGTYLPSSNLQRMYDAPETITLTITRSCSCKRRQQYSNSCIRLSI
jgi:putative ABC transport system permease protein